MSYATREQMIEAFGARELIELTDREQPRTNAIVDAVLARALAAATERMDAYLSARYAVPISPAPPLLAELACDLARDRLYDKQATDEVKRRADAALRLLRDIADGRAALPGVASAAAGATGSVEFGASQRIFGREPL